MKTKPLIRTLEDTRNREVTGRLPMPGRNLQAFSFSGKGGEFMSKDPFFQQEELKFPEVIEQPVMWGYFRDLHQTSRYKAIVDSNTGNLFSIVSQDYRLIRHEEAIERIEEAISESPDLGRYEVNTGFYNKGGRIRQKYIFS